MVEISSRTHMTHLAEEKFPYLSMDDLLGSQLPHKGLKFRADHIIIEGSQLKLSGGSVENA